MADLNCSNHKRDMRHVSPNCSGHPKELLGVADMKKIAEMIGDLHYETLADLLERLYYKLWEDSNKDRDNARTKLGDNLYDAGASISQAAYHIKRAWEISKPFMAPKIKRETLSA